MREKRNQKSLARLFVGAQFAAVMGTLVDFGTMLGLTELIGIWYVTATAIGSFFGAVTNFLLGRYFVFDATASRMRDQAFRYSLVAAGSLLLNTVGVYLVTEFIKTENGGIPYFYSRIIVAVLVAVTYNFYLQKNFVFK